MGEQQQPVIRVHNLTKRFGSVVANRAISLEIGKNEILSIIGENGAGKSTFCKMLTGLYCVDEGQIYLDGQEVRFRNPTESLSAGISMVYQERNLVGMLSVAQNICLGFEPKKRGFLDEATCKRKAMEIRDRLGIRIPVDVVVETLGAGEKQLVEIMRALHNEPKVLILDEPTASLGEGEIGPFLNFIGRLKQEQDISIIFISHKIEEVFQISDRIAVFTDGECTLFDHIENVTQEQCIQAMLRKDKIKPIVVKDKNFDAAKTVLKIGNTYYDDKDHQLDLEIKSGEVAGLYGLVGAGRTEFAEMLYGMRPAKNRCYQFNGEEITNEKTPTMIEKGMIMTPEIRQNGIFTSFSITENIGYLFFRKLLSGFGGFIKSRKTHVFAERVVKKNGVKYNSVDQSIAELSGGNIQKIIIGRSVEIENFTLLILDEPTTGMDIGAKNDVHLKIRLLADNENKSIMFISSELEELMRVCDNIYVFANGNIVDRFGRKRFDKVRILETAIRGRAL